MEKGTPKSALSAACENWLLKIRVFSQKKLLEQLRVEFASLPGKPDPSEISSFLKSMNTFKNRYIDVPCLDKTRVVLNLAGVDYYHANYVNLQGNKNPIIISQAPSSACLSEFYHLLIQERVTLIVCLTRIFENGLQKCYPYWPPSIGSEMIYDKYTVKNVGTEDVCNCRISKLELYAPGNPEPHKINHVFYLDWPDHRVPPCTHKFMAFVDHCSRMLSELGPINKALIHCSAGIGRSGTLACLLKFTRQIQDGEAPDIPKTVALLRQQRANAVQGIEQYMFLYRAVIEYMYSKHSPVTRANDADLVRQITALREVTTQSTCRLGPGERPAVSKLLTAIEERIRMDLHNFNLAVLKAETVKKATKLFGNIQEMGKKFGTKYKKLKKKITTKSSSPKTSTPSSTASSSGSKVKDELTTTAKIKEFDKEPRFYDIKERAKENELLNAKAQTKTKDKSKVPKPPVIKSDQKIAAVKKFDKETRAIDLKVLKPESGEKSDLVEGLDKEPKAMDVKEPKLSSPKKMPVVKAHVKVPKGKIEKEARVEAAITELGIEAISFSMMATQTKAVIKAADNEPRSSTVKPDQTTSRSSSSSQETPKSPSRSVKKPPDNEQKDFETDDDTKPKDPNTQQ